MVTIKWDGAGMVLRFDLDRITRREYWSMASEKAVVEENSLPPLIREQSATKLTDMLLDCCMDADHRPELRARIHKLPWIQWRELVDFFLQGRRAPILI